MPVRRDAEARWEGGLKDGTGKMKLGSGVYEGPYSFGSRFEDAAGTNPEELIGAAHAGCFSMALAAGLGKAGHSPEYIHTRARVQLEKVGDGFAITHISRTHVLPDDLLEIDRRGAAPLAAWLLYV
jgi:osmotically inducible protein OsmC